MCSGAQVSFKKENFVASRSLGDQGNGSFTGGGMHDGNASVWCRQMDWAGWHVAEDGQADGEPSGRARKKLATQIKDEVN